MNFKMIEFTYQAVHKVNKVPSNTGWDSIKCDQVKNKSENKY